MLIPPHVRVLEALIEAIQVRRKARAVKARVLETPSLMQDLLQVYKAIKTENPASTRKVHVFVSTLEADSVCAFRILRVKLASPQQQPLLSEINVTVPTFHP